MSEYKTSWSTSSLLQLSKPYNHRIVFDGYEYVWEHNIDGEWSRHYVRNFQSYKKPYGWLLNCLYRYKKELSTREIQDNKSYFDDMFKGLENDYKVSEIAKDYHSKTKDKVLEIHSIKPDLSAKEISTILDVSKRTVERYLKQ